MSCSDRQGFSLVELLVTISVVSIGLVVIAQSFLTNLSALDISAQYLQATQVLEQRVAEIEEARLRGEPMELLHEETDRMLGVRPAKLIVDIIPLEFHELDEAWTEAAAGGEKKKELRRDFFEVRATITWGQVDQVRRLSLATYLSTEKPAVMHQL